MRPETSIKGQHAEAKSNNGSDWARQLGTGLLIRVAGRAKGRPSTKVKASACEKRRRGFGVVDAVRRVLAEGQTSIGSLRALATCGYSYRYRLLLLALLSPVQSIPALLTPLIMQFLIDKAYPTRDLRLFGWLCAALLALRVLPSGLASVSGYLSTYVQSLIQYKLCLEWHFHKLQLKDR